jgi:hypothetical protein
MTKRGSKLPVPARQSLCAGVAHTFTAGGGARYLIVLTPRLSALISAFQSDHDPAHQHEIYRRFDSELLE